MRYNNIQDVIDVLKTNLCERKTTHETHFYVLAVGFMSL